MWTESRYPSNAPLKPRPQAQAKAFPYLVLSSQSQRGSEQGVGVTVDRSERDMPWLTSGGKVTPTDGQEHPRTEL